MTDRCPCLVPFCRRTARGDPAAYWICGDHWRPVPLRYKRLLSRARRRRDRKAFDLAWWFCRRSAIEIAAGISRR